MELAFGNQKPAGEDKLELLATRAVINVDRKSTPGREFLGEDEALAFISWKPGNRNSSA